VSYSDTDAFDSIADALLDSGSFELVVIDEPSALKTLGPGDYPAVILSPGPWSETPDETPPAVTRQVSFRMVLVTSGDTPRNRLHAVDRLANLAIALIDGSDLGGCIPRLTKLERGEIRSLTEPNLAVSDLVGSFTYLIPDTNARDEAL